MLVSDAALGRVRALPDGVRPKIVSFAADMDRAGAGAGADADDEAVASARCGVAWEILTGPRTQPSPIRSAALRFVGADLRRRYPAVAPSSAAFVNECCLLWTSTPPERSWSDVVLDHRGARWDDLLELAGSYVSAAETQRSGMSTDDAKRVSTAIRDAIAEIYARGRACGHVREMKLETLDVMVSVRRRPLLYPWAGYA
jgi:hypothetical protein